ncbi:hypothetical protein C8R47DRAFT_1155769 [Mycena vitilis]|nr:hypothetical protein C8R47DRAFT_1155769 [Mycena vitilis]
MRSPGREDRLGMRGEGEMKSRRVTLRRCLRSSTRLRGSLRRSMDGSVRCTRRGLSAPLCLSPTLLPLPMAWRVRVASKEALERDSRSWRSVCLRSRAPLSPPLLQPLKTHRNPLHALRQQVPKQTPPPSKRPSLPVSRRCRRNGLHSARRRRHMHPLPPRPSTLYPLSPTTLAGSTSASPGTWA